MSKKWAFTHISFHTEKLWHTDVFTQRNFYIEKFLHREDFTQRSFGTQKFLHAEPFTQSKLLHTTHRSFARRSFCTEQAFTQSQILHREALTYIMAAEIAAPKPGSRRQSFKKRRFWSTFLKEFERENLLPNHHHNLDAATPIPFTIYNSQLQTTIVSRTQPQQPGTLTQPLHCDLQSLSCETP